MQVLHSSKWSKNEPEKRRFTDHSDASLGEPDGFKRREILTDDAELLLIHTKKFCILHIEIQKRFQRRKDDR